MSTKRKRKKLPALIDPKTLKELMDAGRRAYWREQKKLYRNRTRVRDYVPRFSTRLNRGVDDLLGIKKPKKKAVRRRKK